MFSVNVIWRDGQPATLYTGVDSTWQSGAFYIIKQPTHQIAIPADIVRTIDRR
jgi:hypothetical protein